MTASLRARLQADLTAAMKAKDTTRTSVLRSALSALANSEAVAVTNPSSTPVAFGTSEVERKVLGEEDERAVLAAERDELTTSSAALREVGQHDEAARLDAQAEVLSSYLT